MAKVVIFGTGLFSEVVTFYLNEDSEHEIVGYTVNSKYKKDDSFRGLPLVSFETLEEQYPPENFKMFIAIGYSGNNKLRTQKYLEAKKRGYEFITYVCSKSVYWSDLTVGEHCFILENQTIQPYVKIGNNVIIWSGNHIGHHSRIGNNCFITSHVVISGSVSIEDNCFIGVNSNIRDGITISEGSILGSGSNVVKSTLSNHVYIGHAAKIFKSNADDQKNI